MTDNFTDNRKDGINFFGGVLVGLLISIPLWTAIIWVADLVWRHVR